MNYIDLRCSVIIIIRRHNVTRISVIVQTY